MRKSEDLEGEVWKQHPIGIKVSNLGRVETARKGKHYGFVIGNGYLGVWCKGKNYRVNRLICEAFHPNEDNLPYVNHKDEDKQNNRADNLEWCTQKYNVNYGTAQERRMKNTDYTKKSKPILQLNKNLEVVKEWKSAMEAEREGGFHQGNICNCLKGRRKSHKGYIWVYKKNGKAC